MSAARETFDDANKIVAVGHTAVSRTIACAFERAQKSMEPHIKGVGAERDMRPKSPARMPQPIHLGERKRERVPMLRRSMTKVDKAKTVTVSAQLSQCVVLPPIDLDDWALGGGFSM